MKQFLFMYPIKEYFDNELKKFIDFNETDFTTKYFKTLNECIKERYRKKNYTINWALFDKHKISSEIKLESSDKLIYAEVDFNAHCSKKIYPNNDFILNQLNLEFIEHLRVTGFHIWDCVEKIAQRAYERGLDVLIDEDLTEFLIPLIRLWPKPFKRDTYPSYNPKRVFDGQGRERIPFNIWFEARKGKPWFWQDYHK